MKTTRTDLMEDAHGNSAWNQWFELHGPKLLLCARQWTRSIADAEDAVQEAFVRFWRGQRKLSGEPFPLVLTSIRRAAVDLARRNLRRTRRELRALDAAEGDEPLFEPLADGDERRRAIETALKRLPDEQREVLVLKIWGELTFADIAVQLGIPPNTAASRYRYALTTLRHELTETNCHG
jgi:RNA polymerase sigma-70 factor (ECF subfamily)